MMQKISKLRFKCVFILFIGILILSGCASSEETENSNNNKDNDIENNNEISYLNDDEIEYIYSDVSKYKGKYVNMSGKVFVEPERDGEMIYLQVYQKPLSYENNTIVAYEGDIAIKDGDYVSFEGIIMDEFVGKNAFGAEIRAPMILAYELEISTYQEVISPTIREIIINESQEQYGYEVILEKVELAENETRVYLKIINNGNSVFSVYSFNAQLLQGQNQYDEESNWDADYPEIQSSLRVGATTSGIITFPAISQTEKFRLYIDGNSDNWKEDINEYEFEVEID